MLLSYKIQTHIKTAKLNRVSTSWHTPSTTQGVRQMSPSQGAQTHCFSWSGTAGIHDRFTWQVPTHSSWNLTLVWSFLMFRHKVKPTIGGSCAFLISLISSKEHFPSYRGNVGLTTTKISNRANTYQVHLKLTQFIAEIMEKATL